MAFTRRQFLGTMIMANPVFAQRGSAVALPPPQTIGSVPLMQALRQRRSTREFSSRPLPREVLSTLLWSAFGVNRPETGGRTAPSAHNWQEIDVYAAMADGSYRYDPRDHVLQPVHASDLRAATGVQDFVAQNVYLFCAAAGLGCVVRGRIDRRSLAPALHLRGDQRIMLAQTVGYPR